MQVAVIGSGAEHEGRAEEVGRLLAERGCTVVTGGLGEVMAAAARGAKSAGGTTIGILPGERRDEANEWIDHAVVTGIGHARNLAVAASGDAVIAVGGSWGTLAEIGFATRPGRRTNRRARRPTIRLLPPPPHTCESCRPLSCRDQSVTPKGFRSANANTIDSTKNTIIQFACHPNTSMSRSGYPTLMDVIGESCGSGG